MDPKCVQNEFQNELEIYSKCIPEMDQNPSKMYPKRIQIVSHMDPDILLLDEVMTVGDYDFRKRSRTRIEEMVRGDATVVIVSHSPFLIRELCDRAFYLEDGQFKTDGDIEKAIEQYESDRDVD